jgi:hypothetical protein
LHPFGRKAPELSSEQSSEQSSVELLDFWGIGVYDLRLTEHEFLELTPKLFEKLCGRKYQNERRELTNAALIAAVVINVNRTKGKRAVKIKDIIGEDITCETKEASEEELLDLIKFVGEYHGTKV